MYKIIYWLEQINLLLILSELLQGPMEHLRFHNCDG